MNKAAAIYHFTDTSDRRPSVYIKTIKQLEEYALNMGFKVLNTYCDMSLKKMEHTQFNNFLNDKYMYGVLILRDFYHLSKNTGECMKLLKVLNETGIDIYTMVDGCFLFTEPPFNKKLRVAVYYNENNNKDRSSELQMKIFKMYINNKTNWSIIDTYIDKENKQNNKQDQLLKLENNLEKYDLVLLKSFIDISNRTSKFCKWRNLMKLDIFSLYEGYLKYNKACVREEFSHEG